MQQAPDVKAGAFALLTGKYRGKFTEHHSRTLISRWRVSRKAG
jgi:hypothetical protein